MTTFKEFWARSAHFGQNWGWDDFRGARVFCGKPDDLSGISQQSISTKFDHETYFGVPSRNPKDIFQNFYFRGHLPPKSEIENRSNGHLTESRLQITGYTADRCLLHVVVQGPGSFRVGSTFLYDVQLRSYVASKLPNFRILAYFPHTKRLKRTFRWSAYSPGVSSQNDSDFSVW